MAKPEWGVKRICQGCAAVFYDLRKKPIVCPKCGVEYDPEAVLRSRRGRPAPPEEAKPVVQVLPVVAAKPAEPEVVEPEKEEATEEAAETVLEDASELGEDEDDVAEVIENVDETPEKE